MFKHILIPTDGSPVAEKAIHAGVALAAEMGASVTGYFAVQSRPTHVDGEGYLTDRKLVDELERRAMETGEKSVAAVARAAKAAGVKFDTVVGKAALAYKGIIEAAQAKGCDAVFMASNGHRGLTGLLLGSVTEKVLAHSKIPVLVFR